MRRSSARSAAAGLLRAGGGRPRDLAEEAATSSEPEARAAATEAGLRAAVDRAPPPGRRARPDAAFLRVLLAGEAADRDAVAADSPPPVPRRRPSSNGAAAQRWSALERWAYRDPLGIGRWPRTSRRWSSR
jgi:hypothetical protein